MARRSRSRSASPASNVKSVSIANSGYWLMEEQPAATMAAITAFIDA